MQAARNGKLRLIDAALKLAAHTRSLEAVKLREIAREAGLNPNTFYRHFSCLDDLGLAIIDRLVTELRGPLREQRIRAAQAVIEQFGGQVFSANSRRWAVQGQEINRRTVSLFFRFVEENRYGFIVGLRELHGASPRLRTALRQAMEEFARDMAEDLDRYQMLQVSDPERGLSACRLIVRQMFTLSMDYLEQPDDAGKIAVCREAEEMIMAIIIGYSGLDQLPTDPDTDA